MYTFLVYAGLDEAAVDIIGSRANRILQNLIPKLDCTLQLKVHSLPQISGGYFTIVPAELDNYHLVSEYMDEQLAVVVFGDVPSTTAPPAETIARIWRTGGTDGVHSLDASFSAVIMELPHKRVHVVSDTMGLRGLHYFTNGSALLISPHDLCILATGLCPAELDRLSIASLLSCDWSLGGQPLLKNILSCEPDFYYIWGGDWRKKLDFRLHPEHRIEPDDRKGVDSQIARMIENLCQKARSLCGDQELIRLELTAGMDSRAVAAILLSVIGPSRMEAQTSGSPDHYEVKTARRICRHYGIRHKDYAPTANQSGTFLEHSRLIAFFSNGMGNSKGAFRGLPKLRIQRPPIFIGNGGEVFRGFYYPSPLRTPILSNMDIDSVASCLAKKVLTRPGPAWLDPEIPKQLNKRLEEAVGNCARISDFPADIFTLFYLRERYRLWGGLSTRVPWTRAVAPCLTAQAW